MGENVLHGRNTVFGFVYFVYLYFFLGIFQKTLLNYIDNSKKRHCTLNFYKRYC